MLDRTLIAIAVAISGGLGAAFAQESRPVLTHQSAMTVVSTCTQWAEDRDLNLTIAVIDHGARLRGFVSMDEAFAVSWRLAERKAWSALALQAPTDALGWVSDVPGIEAGGDLVPLQGGTPIFTEDGVILGAVGVSGASSELDEQCAVAGVEAAGLNHGVETAEAE